MGRIRRPMDSKRKLMGRIRHPMDFVFKFRQIGHFKHLLNLYAPSFFPYFCTRKPPSAGESNVSPYRKGRPATDIIATRRMTMNKCLPLLIMSLLLLCSCDSLFSYHPYDARFSGQTDINAANISRIEALCRGKDTLRFAFIGDTHEWYSDTKDMMAALNANDSIDFVVHGGDLTDVGTTKEFVWARDILGGLRKPYVALIGNHDFLGTGNEVYGKMYGAVDFSFIAARIKFVCLNTNATEYDYMAAVPNFDFMEEQLTADSAAFDRTIVCMHARPYSDQFNNNVVKAFEHYVSLFPGLLFCLNAHDHHLQADDLYGDGIMYYGCASVEKRNYLLFTITPTGYTYEVVYF